MRLLERFVDKVAHFGGSWNFIISMTIFLIVWMTFNAVSLWTFDEYPFILLNLILNIIFSFEAPFIMMSQERAAEHQDVLYRNLLRELKDLIQSDLNEDRQTNRALKEMKEQLDRFSAQITASKHDNVECKPENYSKPVLWEVIPKKPDQKPAE
jgi:uncharacterized membrane protein